MATIKGLVADIFIIATMGLCTVCIQNYDGAPAIISGVVVVSFVIQQALEVRDQMFLKKLRKSLNEKERIKNDN